jgi:ATP-dependent Clp protease ATP-binding subunit ClpC
VNGIAEIFDRYTERAKRALFFARYEASELGARSIETEHILLGVIRASNHVTNVVFARAGLAVETIRQEIENRSLFRERVSTSVEMPFSAGSERVILHTLAEADRLGHYDIDVEHQLLGILNEDTGTAGSVLRDKGMVLDKARESVLQVRSELGGEED